MPNIIILLLLIHFRSPVYVRSSIIRLAYCSIPMEVIHTPVSHIRFGVELVLILFVEHYSVGSIHKLSPLAFRH